MKFDDLLVSGLVKDTDKISLTVCTRHRTTLPELIDGKWYEDKILDCTDMEISELKYSSGNGNIGLWLVTLEDVEDE